MDVPYILSSIGLEKNVQICDDEFYKYHIVVNLCSLQLCVHEWLLQICVKRVYNLFQRC